MTLRLLSRSMLRKHQDYQMLLRWEICVATRQNPLHQASAFWALRNMLIERHLSRKLVRKLFPQTERSEKISAEELLRAIIQKLPLIVVAPAPRVSRSQFLAILSIYRRISPSIANIDKCPLLLYLKAKLLLPFNVKPFKITALRRCKQTLRR